MTANPNSTPVTYTVVAIYRDNYQRYATSSCAENPTEAVANAIFDARNDNQEPEEISICAVFLGEHSAKDNEWDARERPEYKNSRAKDKPFTVVFGEGAVSHVSEPNASLAEYRHAEDYDEVGGVFEGHLVNLLGHVDLAEAYTRADSLAMADG